MLISTNHVNIFWVVSHSSEVGGIFSRHVSIDLLNA